VARVVIDHDFSAPRPAVFDHLAEHENLEPLFGARIVRVHRPDDQVRNGIGSTRTLKLGPLPSFDETVTEYRQDELIRYTIASGSIVASLITGHEGIQTYTVTPIGGTHLHYEIDFGAKIPGLAGLLARVLQSKITAALPAVDASLTEHVS
jgi:hypothetical protein